MKLHLGAGDKFLPGYVHIDINRHSHIDYVADVRDLSLLESDCADEIYASHVLEHFTRLEISNVLKEWYRVLCSGGLLRLAVPDFEAIAEQYRHDGDLDALLGLLYGGQNYQHNFHYQTYDFNRITNLLKAVGFKSVERYIWQDFLPDDYDDFSRAYIPHMDFANGRLMSLNVIARK